MTATELLRDPYPVFKRLRLESPVSRLEPEGYWLIARHADVLAVLKDPQRFSSRGNLKNTEPTDPVFLLKTRSLVGADQPEHTRLRGIIREAFSPSRLRLHEARIRSLVRARMSDFARRGRFELVAELSARLPMEVFALLLGVAPEMAPEFQKWAAILVSWGSPDCRATEAEAMDCASQMHDYFARAIAIAARGNTGDEDLLALLSRHANDGAERALAPWELIAFARLLLVAGTETTTHLIGNTMLALLEQPGLWRAVKQDRSRIPELIEESLRFDSPVPSLIRRVSVDTSIAGTRVREGEIVLPLLGSANHDETVFADPERFSLERPPRPHLSFGAGSHYCMGVVLARIQARVVFEELFDAFSEISCGGCGPVKRVESFFVRGPTELPVRGVRSPVELRAEIG